MSLLLKLHCASYICGFTHRWTNVGLMKCMCLCMYADADMTCSFVARAIIATLISCLLCCKLVTALYMFKLARTTVLINIYTYVCQLFMQYIHSSINTLYSILSICSLLLEYTLS
jgi:hypothetical protein